MNSRAIVDFLAGQLVESTPAHERERALLRAVCAMQGEIAVELWRDFGFGAAQPAGPRGWFATRSQGARHALPPPQLVVAALQGAIDCELSERAAVIRAGAIAPELALVVAGAAADEQLFDAAHALLLVFALTQPAAHTTDAHGASLAPPFPARDESDDAPRQAPDVA